MEKLKWILFALPLFVKAQAPGGGCSITLLSEETTINQGFCVDPVNAAIEPVLYAIEGTGLQVTDLPPGVTSTFANDTLTISGTITSTGVWFPEISLNEGCLQWGPTFVVSQKVDPGLSCTVVGDSITVSWPGLDAPLQQDGTMFLFWTDGVDLLGQMTYFLPCPGSYTVGGLPVNTPITFYLSLISGLPNCFMEELGTTCTIISTDVMERREGDLAVSAIPHGDRLELASPMELREVCIYDMLGGLVTARTVNGRTVSVPTASVVPGAYILRTVGVDGRVSVQRFVQER